MRRLFRHRLLATVAVVASFALTMHSSGAQEIQSSDASHSEVSDGSEAPNPTMPSGLGSQTMGAERKAKRASKPPTPPKRRQTGKADTAARAALRKEQSQIDPQGTLQYLWGTVVFHTFYPFKYLNDKGGAAASNSFGFFLLLMAIAIPRIFGSGRERELRLKERLVRAKNTRVRVRAAKNLDEYSIAVNLIQEDDLSYPLKGLRKLLRLPPADPASYSQAVKDVKKEVIHVNEDVFPPGPRSMDRAIKEIKRNLVQHLNVREADASQMTSTIIAKSCHARSSDDAELAIKAIVGDTGLVELRRFHKRPLKVVVSDSIVEVRRSVIYEVLPTALAGSEDGDPLMFVKCKWSMQFRSNTDEGTVTIRRFHPGQKREKKEKAKIEEKTMGTRAREHLLLWARNIKTTKERVDTWIDIQVQRVLYLPRGIHSYIFPPPPPSWGPAGQAIHEAADACNAATTKEDYMAVLKQLGKASMDLNEASEALGGLAVGEAATEAQMLRDLAKEIVHMDGFEFKPAEIGTAKTVKAVERHLRGILDVPKEEARATSKCALLACCRTRVEADALQVVSALGQNMKGMVAIVPHSTQYPLKMRSEGKSGMRQKALCAEARTLYRISATDKAGEAEPVWGFLETCVSVSVPMSANPVDPMPGRITVKLVDRAPQAAASRTRTDRPPLPPNGVNGRHRRGSAGESTLRPVRDKLTNLTIQRGGISTVPNTPRDPPTVGEYVAGKNRPGDKKPAAGGSTASSMETGSVSHSTSTASSMNTSPMSMPDYNIPSSSATSSQSSPDVLPFRSDPAAEDGAGEPLNASESDRVREQQSSDQLPNHDVPEVKFGDMQGGTQAAVKVSTDATSFEARFAARKASRDGLAAKKVSPNNETAADSSPPKTPIKGRSNAETIDAGDCGESFRKPPIPPSFVDTSNGRQSKEHDASATSSQGRHGSISPGVNPKVVQALAKRFLRKSGLTPPSTPGSDSVTISTANTPRSGSAAASPAPNTPSPSDSSASRSAVTGVPSP